MCLAIPARVVALLEDERCRVDLDGVAMEVSLALVDEVSVGDYVIVHVGHALARLDREEAEHTLAVLVQAGLASAPPLAGDAQEGVT